MYCRDPTNSGPSAASHSHTPSPGSSSSNNSTEQQRYTATKSITGNSASLRSISACQLLLGWPRPRLRIETPEEELFLAGSAYIYTLADERRPQAGAC